MLRSKINRLVAAWWSAHHPERYTSEINAAKLEAVRLEKDKARLDWLDTQGVAYGFEETHEGNRWLLDGPFNSVRDAIDAGRGATHPLTKAEEAQEVEKR